MKTVTIKTINTDAAERFKSRLSDKDGFTYIYTNTKNETALII